MKRTNKKNKSCTLGVLLCTFILLTGCSTKVDKDKYSTESSRVVSEEIKSIERYNVATDLKMFSDAYNALNKETDSLVNTETDKETLNQKTALAQINYMNIIYKMGINRITLDAAGLYNDSDEYLSYIALIQTYCDYFTEEKEKMTAEMNLENISEYKSGRALVLLEEYYISLWEKI